jgi:hypothetical protein
MCCVTKGSEACLGLVYCFMALFRAFSCYSLISDLFAQFDPSVRFVFKYSFLVFWVSNYIILFCLTLPRVFVK